MSLPQSIKELDDKALSRCLRSIHKEIRVVKMKLYGKETSRLFAEFVSTYAKALGARIQFRQMEDHPARGFLDDFLGTSQYDKGRNSLTIFVNVTLMDRGGFPAESRETTAAHEILHPWLISVGFPTTRSQDNLPDDCFERRIGGYLHSVIHHISIDEILRSSGFDPSIVVERLSKLYIARVKEQDYQDYFPGKPLFAKEALDYVEANLRYPPNDVKEVREILKGKNENRFCR